PAGATAARDHDVKPPLSEQPADQHRQPATAVRRAHEHGRCYVDPRRVMVGTQHDTVALPYGNPTPYHHRPRPWRRQTENPASNSGRHGGKRRRHAYDRTTMTVRRGPTTAPSS